MKLSESELSKRLIYNNFLNFFSLTLEAKSHKGCSYTLPDGPFVLFNAILETKLKDNNVSHCINELKAIYHSHKRNFCWWFTDFVQPQALKTLLLKEGFSEGPAFKGMIYDFSQEIKAPITIKQIEVQEVTSASQLDEWVKPLQQVFAIDEQSAQCCVKNFKNVFHDSRLKHYFIAKQGSIVATASLFIENAVAGFYNLAVLPEYRGNHFATALKYHRLQESKKQDAKAAILQSSEMGRALDQRIGFKPVLDFIPLLYEGR